MCRVRLRHRELSQRPELPHVSHPQMDLGSPCELHPRPVAKLNEEPIMRREWEGGAFTDGNARRGARRREFDSGGHPSTANTAPIVESKTPSVT